MGLDQYMFRCSKPKVKEGRVYERGDSLIDNCVFVPKDEIDSPAYRSLKQFSVPIKMEENVYDVEKMAENYDMNKEKCHICGIIGGDIHITDGNKEKEIKEEEVNAIYTKTIVCDIFVCKTEQVLYWRKAYDVSELMNQKLPFELENCGFYPVNRDVAESLNELDYRVEPDDYPEDIEESNMMYHEWY